MIRRVLVVAAATVLASLAAAGSANAGEKCFEIPPDSGHIYCVTTP